MGTSASSAPKSQHWTADFLHREDSPDVLTGQQSRLPLVDPSKCLGRLGIRHRSAQGTLDPETLLLGGRDAGPRNGHHESTLDGARLAASNATHPPWLTPTSPTGRRSTEG